DHVAALGGNVTVTTLDGNVDLTVPPTSSTGRVLRLRGQGWHKKGGGRGDALVEVRVTVPETLTVEQRALYGKLAGAYGGSGASAQTSGGAQADRGGQTGRSDEATSGTRDTGAATAAAVD